METEEEKLYRLMTAPLEPCSPLCDVYCVCDREEDSNELPSP